MARPAKLGKTVQVAFRLPVDLVRRLDGYAEGLEAAEPGRIVSRAEAARILLLRGLGEGKSSGQRVLHRFGLGGKKKAES